MISEIRAGIAQVQDGAINPARADRFGSLVTQDSVGKFYELARQGRVFTGALQSGTALGTALTSSAVTFTLYNPSGSGVNLSILQTQMTLTALQTTTANIQAFAYAVNGIKGQAGPSSTTPLSATAIFPALIGGSSSPIAQVYTAATLPATPVVARWFPLSAYCTVTTQLAETALHGIDYVEGALCLAPGSMVTIQGIAGTTGVTGVIAMTWAEIPV
jgi:hypothetical protein